MSATLTIEIDRAAPGMVLAAPLRDGRVILLPSGATLSAPLLSNLRARGIAALEVVAPAAEPEPVVALDPAEQARRAARLAHLFRHSAGQAATPRLLQLIQTWRQCAGTEGGDAPCSN